MKGLLASDGTRLVICAVVCFSVVIAVTVFDPLPFPFSLLGAIVVLVLAYIFLVRALSPG